MSHWVRSSAALVRFLGWAAVNRLVCLISSPLSTLAHKCSIIQCIPSRLSLWCLLNRVTITAIIRTAMIIDRNRVKTLMGLGWDARMLFVSLPLLVLIFKWRCPGGALRSTPGPSGEVRSGLLLMGEPSWCLEVNQRLRPRHYLNDFKGQRRWGNGGRVRYYYLQCAVATGNTTPVYQTHFCHSS